MRLQKFVEPGRFCRGAVCGLDLHRHSAASLIEVSDLARQDAFCHETVAFLMGSVVHFKQGEAVNARSRGAALSSKVQKPLLAVTDV